MSKKLTFWILVLILLILIGAGIVFSDFFKVLFGVTGNVVRVVG